MKPNKTLAAALAVALSAGAASAIALASPASAATGTTAAISGVTINNVGSVWYDSSTNPKPAVNPGPNRTVDLTTVKNGANLDFTITLSAGPQNGPFSPAAANTYKLDALVRLDGAAGTPGSFFAGPEGTVLVAPASPTFAGGTTITGSFPNVSAGAHKVTLTNLVLDSKGGSSGTEYATTAGQLQGFDIVYGTGTTSASIITSPGDWLQEYYGTNVVSVSNQLASVTDYVRVSGIVAQGGQLGVVTLASGPDYTASLASAALTVSLCDVTGTTCDAALATADQTLATSATGKLSGTLTVPAGATAGQRAIKVYDGTNTTLTPIKVLAAPVIQITPSNGQVGFPVAITGTGFNPGAFGVAHASIPNPAFCNITPGTCTGPPPYTPVDNYAVGPAKAGPNNTIVGFTATATGTMSATVTVTDPASYRIQASQKLITGGVQANTELTMKSLNAGASVYLPFTVNPDTTKPTGTASVNPKTGGLNTTSTLTLANIADNAGAANVTKSVTWGDGSAAQAVTGTTATHKYTKLGTFPVSVSLKDVAGNSTTITAGSVVLKDKTKPVVSLTTPKKATKASSWTTIKGKASDTGGAGIQGVAVLLIEKNKSNGKWYYYNGKKWVKTTSRAKAESKAKPITDASIVAGAWSIKLKKKPAKGTLYVAYVAVDKAGNFTGKTKTQKITK